MRGQIVRSALIAAGMAVSVAGHADPPSAEAARTDEDAEAAEAMTEPSTGESLEPVERPPGPPPTAEDLEEARKLFNAGARAYGAGKYVAAIRAFEEAYRRSARSGLLFSLAQAHRHQFFVDRDIAHLKLATAYYRQYLDAAPDGKRRADSAQALAELGPLVARAEAAGDRHRTTGHRASTQLMISSPIDGVALELDGKPAGELPFISDVEPGLHRVELSKPGYHGYSRQVRVPKGGVVPIDATLKERPARLEVAAPPGAEVLVDGRSQGFSPIGTLDLSPGRHFIAVTKNGRRPFVRELELERGTQTRLEADMETTGQRVAGWVLLGAGATAMATGAGFCVLALERQSDAENILEQRDIENIDEKAAERYADAVEDRDRWRTIGVASAGAGLVTSIIGVTLLVFDQPRVEPPPQADDSGQEPSEPATMEISVAPLVGPAGAGLMGRF